MPGRATVDFSLMKNFDVTEEAKLQFRFEAFNLFNRVNFGTPARTVRNTAGVLNATAGTKLFDLPLTLIASINLADDRLSSSDHVRVTPLM